MTARTGPSDSAMPDAEPQFLALSLLTPSHPSCSERLRVMRQQSTSSTPNSCLRAILLITRSRAGPRLVFHYPAVPSTSSYTTKHDTNWYSTTGNATEGSDAASDGWSDGGDSVGSSSDGESSRAGSGTGSKASKLRSSNARSRTTGGFSSEIDEESLDPNDSRGDGKNGKSDGREFEQAVPGWEKVLGFSADGLSYLLSPSKSYNKRRFEISVEQFVFVGAPMFVRDDGYWKKRRRHRRKESVAATDMATDRRTRPLETPVTSPSKLKRPSSLELVPGYDAGYGHGLVSGAASATGSDAQSASTAAEHREMTMFNIVFVLDPPSLEHHARVDEMYDFVVKRFAKDLKYEQAKSNWVAQEAVEILKLKDAAKESGTPISTLWPKLVATSALAKAIAITYDSITDNKIAHIDLNGFDTSFQIPQAVSTPFIPTATEPQMPGLWLTTATLVDDDEADASLSSHSALLLLEDDDALLKEIESDGTEHAGPLAAFVRALTPTKSLLKLSQKHSMRLKDVQILARHLIYWRRARAIPPLHWRDTYIVSPNADMRTLATAIPAFATRFPTSLSLTKILHMLSGPPRPYRLHMPSLDHRPMYMDILAWLMRGGWVTQLRSFAWVRVSREVKATVAAKLNQEERHSSIAVQVESVDGSSTFHTRENSDHFQNTQIQRSPEGKAPSEAGLSHTSPHLSPYRYPAAPPSDAGSTSSSRTAVHSGLSALSPLQRPDSRTFHRPSPLHINQSISPSAVENAPPSPSLASTTHLTSSSSHQNGTSALDASELKSENPSDYEPSLVYSPQRAGHEESAWIEHIGSLVPSLYPSGASTNGHTPLNTGEEARELWPVMLKYFDGRYALEEISAREGLKKKRVREFLSRLTKEGILVIVRHW